MVSFLLSLPAHAELTAEQQARANHLYHSLRCVVCEGQPLAESNTEIAVQMRRMVREKITAGETDAEILNFFSTRYGDSILMQPPVNLSTLPLWLSPLLLLAIGLWLFTRRKK